MKFSSALFALSSAFLAPAAAQTIVEVAVENGSFNTLVELVTEAELVELLSGDGPFTVFAPTDDAFTALGPVKYTEPDWSVHLEDILKYHVVVDTVMSTDLALNLTVGMANGGEATITSLEPPMINDATIVIPDVSASNGVVHAVDSVLLPTSATSTIADILTSPAAEGFSTLLSAVQAADLAETLGGEGPFTVFAPTDEAFAAVDSAVIEYLLSPEGKEDLINVLTYHVYAGIVYQRNLVDVDLVMVNEDTAVVVALPPTIAGADIVEGEILASNGVIHAIDSVILPPSFEPPSVGDGEETDAPADSAATTMGSLVALASAAVAMMIL